MPGADEAAFAEALEALLTKPPRLAAMRRAARDGAAALHEQLQAEPSVQGAVGEFETLLRVAMCRCAVDEAVEADESTALWRHHLRWTRGPVLIAVLVQLALLLFLRIPAEASALDEALASTFTVAEALNADTAAWSVERIGARALSIAFAALPGALAFGLPLAASLRLQLPLVLTRRPPLRARAWTVGVLALASALSVVATHTLRGCLAPPDAPPDASEGGSGARTLSAALPCARSVFAWSRNPINVSTLLVAAALNCLAPSAFGVLGACWLGSHFDERVQSFEEVFLHARFGAEWEAYARTAPRWLDGTGAATLLVSALGCGLIARCLIGSPPISPPTSGHRPSADGERPGGAGMKRMQPRLALLFLLYCLQGLVFGFVGGALPVLVPGVSFSSLGLLSLSLLPFALKVVFAPFIDVLWLHRCGRRKSWVVPCTALSELRALSTARPRTPLSVAGPFAAALVASFSWLLTQTAGVISPRLQAGCCSRS